MDDWRLLRADEIELRTGQISKSTGKQSILLYKDARCDMSRLDELGRFNWQREHKDIHGVSYCGVSIWDESKKMFVTKWDAGEKSNASPEKGEASDSFKRACVNWGIGRELYTAPNIWVSQDLKPAKMKVAEIEYEKREIVKLVIEYNDNGSITEIYRYAVGQRLVTRVPGNLPPKAVAESADDATHQDTDEAPTSAENDQREAFDQLMADIQSVQTSNDLVGLMNSTRVQQSPYKIAILQAGHNFAKGKGWE